MTGVGWARVRASSSPRLLATSDARLRVTSDVHVCTYVYVWCVVCESACVQ